MLKKITFKSLVLSLALTMVLSVSAFAISAETINKVNTTNNQINQMISAAVAQANQYTSNYQSKVVAEKAKLTKDINQNTVINQRIYAYTNDYNNQINDLGNNLVSNAYNKVLDLYNATSRDGVTLSCEYIPVKLGDKIFLVDPLRFVCR